MKKFLTLICTLNFLPNSSVFAFEKNAISVPFDQTNNIILQEEDVKKGKRLFNNTCAVCHAGGVTKTNPNVGLDLDALNKANPPRNTVLSLIDFLENPKTYDGLESIAEIHPSIKSADIFPKMRSLTDGDLYSIASYILAQPTINPDKWGIGKTHY